MSFRELMIKAAAAGGGSIIPPGMTAPLNMMPGGINKTPLPDSMLQASQDPAASGGGGGASGGGESTGAGGAPKQAKVDVGATVMMLAKMLSVVIDKLGIDIPTGVMVQSPGDVAAFQSFMLNLAQGGAPGAQPQTQGQPQGDPAAAAAQAPAPAEQAMPAQAPAAPAQGMDPTQELAMAAMGGQAPKTAGDDMFVEPGYPDVDRGVRSIPLAFNTPASNMRALAGTAAILWNMQNDR